MVVVVRVAVKEFHLGYYIGETLLITIYIYIHVHYGNLIQVPLTATQ